MIFKPAICKSPGEYYYLTNFLYQSEEEARRDLGDTFIRLANFSTELPEVPPYNFTPPARKDPVNAITPSPKAMTPPVPAAPTFDNFHDWSPMPDELKRKYDRLGQVPEVSPPLDEVRERPVDG